MKQLLLGQTTPYRFILGVRDTQRTKAAFDEVQYDSAKHSLTLLPLELADLKNVHSFAQQALQHLGETKIDYLFLNAGMFKSAAGPGPHGSKWSETYIVNHLCTLLIIATPLTFQICDVEDKC